MSRLSEATAFPPGSEAAWRAAVAKALKGPAFETLTHRTADNVPIQPLYAAGSGPVIVGGRGARPWIIASRIDLPEFDAAVDTACAEVDRGAECLVLAPTGARAARGFGLTLGAVGSLSRSLAQVDLERVSIRLDPSLAMLPAAAIAKASFGAHRLAGAIGRIGFGFDPIGIRAATGEPVADEDTLGAKVRELHEEGFTGPWFFADGHVWHEAGATEAQELAFVLATLVHDLRLCANAGVPREAAVAGVSASLAATVDQFLTVAKFRALRLLWARLLEVSELAQAPLVIHAETSWRMMTRRDPWANIVRCTVAGFAAAVGDADSLVVTPFTAPLGLPDETARRLARNTQLVLREEVQVWRVGDPAAGSGAIETLTGALAQKAWEILRIVESAGGIGAALQSGTVARLIAPARDAARLAAETGEQAMIGTTLFLNPDETPPDVLAPPVPLQPPHEGALPSERLSEAFEDFPSSPERSRGDSNSRGH